MGTDITHYKAFNFWKIPIFVLLKITTTTTTKTRKQVGFHRGKDMDF